MKYIFIRKQKVVLYPKLKENQKKAAASALMAASMEASSMRNTYF
jgi:hypothetical protein